MFEVKPKNGDFTKLFKSASVVWDLEFGISDDFGWMVLFYCKLEVLDQKLQLLTLAPRAKNLKNRFIFTPYCDFAANMQRNIN